MVVPARLNNVVLTVLWAQWFVVGRGLFTAGGTLHIWYYYLVEIPIIIPISLFCVAAGFTLKDGPKISSGLLYNFLYFHLVAR